MWTEWMAIAGAGVWAGMINVIVGSGTLVTFPVLLLLGYPPLAANVSNSIGLLGGNLAGTFGYRRELGGNPRLLRRLLPSSIAGGITGAALLLALPAEAFAAIVPVLVVLGLVMVVAGPAVQRRAARRNGGVPRGGAHGKRLAAVTVATFVVGIYGGYFGAAQGILLVGMLGMLTAASLQSINAMKNLLVTGVNGIAAVVFVLVAWDAIDWIVVALIALGSAGGGVLGARFGRRLSPAALRAVIVVVGTVAVVNMLFV
ncbi:sulfite exporter TauE/SafE family protein [Aeromicrobium phragmitis]|uniref:Probable membrane transporter protein n=1 Tax=Aeromicrobium phragmitis TaxID=2478914 RepID=A0A3L8PJF7_9ACTN|nr:sulfite exporter TauE/SafE family protein [Aeromicrobium phragmitis]RLV55526.1 sulfite exporter TauE/SafE family protein [Aeromicrobium phragmitis]